MKKLVVLLSLAVLFFTLTPSAHAADPPPGACPNGCSSEKICELVPGGSSDVPNDWSCFSEDEIKKNFASAGITCSDEKSINTALGCIPTDPQQFVQAFFPWAIGIAGTAALLLISFGAFSYITAAGNPEKLQKAKETITSAIAGLLIIIFSVLLLKIIGVDILDLPGFSGTPSP